MNRFKIFSIISIIIFIIVILATNVFAIKKISSDGTVSFTGVDDLYNSGNVFCVAHQQEMRKNNI